MKLNNKITNYLEFCSKRTVTVGRNIEVYANYNILPITELHCFQILCVLLTNLLTIKIIAKIFS